MIWYDMIYIYIYKEINIYTVRILFRWLFAWQTLAKQTGNFGGRLHEQDLSSACFSEWHGRVHQQVQQVQHAWAWGHSKLCPSDRASLSSAWHVRWSSHTHGRPIFAPPRVEQSRFLWWCWEECVAFSIDLEEECEQRSKHCISQGGMVLQRH